MQNTFYHMLNYILSNLYVNQHKICCYFSYNVIQYKAIRTACQHGLSSFIVRKRKIVQFWLVLLDKMFFHNLSDILTLLFTLQTGVINKFGVLFLPQIEM